MRSELNKLVSNRWNNSRLLDAYVYSRNKQGIYAIGVVNKNPVAGLPENWTWVYVGISDNIKGRIRQHQPDKERKTNLRKWLYSNLNRAQIYYQYTQISGKNLKLIETSFIQSLKPIFNILKKRKTRRRRK